MVHGSGKLTSKLWFIGEAPGQTEIVQGQPFVGVAGNTLRRFCVQIGIDPTDCYLDNIYSERAPRDQLNLLFKDGQPRTLELAASIEQLNEKIRTYRPNVIVALGAIPTHVLTDKLVWNAGTFSSIHDWRGSILEHKSITGQKIIPTFHPSYISRAYADHGIFIADLSRALAESAFAEIRRPHKELILGPQGHQLQLVKERLLDEKSTITCDIEYTGHTLICVGLTNASSWAASVRIHSPSELQVCHDILLSGQPLNMQNSMFDCSILEWHYKIPAIKHLAFDTMLAAHAISPELPKDLGFLNSIYTDQPFYKNMVDWKAIKAGTQSIETVLEYNAIDTWTQHEIMEKQLAEDFAENPRLYETFLFEMALLQPLWEMSKRGIRVDKAKLAEWRQSLVAQLAQHDIILTFLNGGKKVNVKSQDDVTDFLFNYLEIRPSTNVGKRGLPKVDDKTLAMLINRCKNDKQRYSIAQVRSARQCRDLLSKLVDVPIDEDGRSRGMYNPGGTVTGRLSSKKFYPTGRGHQQQNIPNKGKHVFVPDDGKLFGIVDYERAESLVVAHLTNDSLMLKHHEPGADAHTLLAQLFYKCEASEITKERRFTFKQTRHAGNYMEGPVTLMFSINKLAHLTGVSITLKQAKEYIEWYRSVHTELMPWWLNIREQLTKKKVLTNLLGRERVFFDRPDNALTAAVAYVPQGTVGDLMNIGLLNLHGTICSKARELLPWHEEIPSIAAELRGLGFELLNQVHDSVGFQFDRQHETRVRELVHKCLHIPLRNPHTLEQFFVGQELKVGNSWGEAS